MNKDICLGLVVGFVIGVITFGELILDEETLISSQVRMCQSLDMTVTECVKYSKEESK